MCNRSCNECCRKIFSTGVSIVAINGVNTLVIDIPSQSFRNGERGCIVITQAIPDETTIVTPVAISIGGDTTTVYEVVSCDCSQVIACMIRPRRRYPYKVSTSLSGGVFKFKNLSCAPSNNVTEIPIIAPATGG